MFHVSICLCDILILNVTQKPVSSQIMVRLMYFSSHSPNPVFLGMHANWRAVSCREFTTITGTCVLKLVNYYPPIDKDAMFIYNFIICRFKTIQLFVTQYQRLDLIDFHSYMLNLLTLITELCGAPKWYLCFDTLKKFSDYIIVGLKCSNITQNLCLKLKT